MNSHVTDATAQNSDGSVTRTDEPRTVDHSYVSSIPDKATAPADEVTWRRDYFDEFYLAQAG
ncbi:MAG: hypothetical protein AAF439_05940 [Pseudomonadota bacterium]